MAPYLGLRLLVLTPRRMYSIEWMAFDVGQQSHVWARSLSTDYVLKNGQDHSCIISNREVMRQRFSRIVQLFNQNTSIDVEGYHQPPQP